MNTLNQRYTRFLYLFPVDALKAAWPNHAGKKEEVVDLIVASDTKAAIDGFAARSFGVTKHRAYLFAAPGPASLNNFSLPATYREIDRTAASVTFVTEMVYSAFSPDAAGPTEVHFMWPVRISVVGNNVQVAMIILEKNLQAYLPAGFKLLTARKSIDEKEIVSQVVLGFANAGTVLTALDLHRGVKHLWNQGTIDSPKSCWKEANGTSTKTMDVNQLLRRDDLPTFQKLIAGPLFRTLFQTLAQNVNFPAYFAVDPAAGQITFPRYCSDATFSDNVVREILQNN